MLEGEVTDVAIQLFQAPFCLGTHLPIHQVMGGRNSPSKVPLGHGQDPARQVPQIVGQIAVDPVNEGAAGEVPVKAKGYLPQEEIAEGVHTELVGDLIGVNDVSGALAHLLPFHRPPSMGEDPPGQGEVGGHEEGGPVDGVKAKDILPYDMAVGRPVALKTFPVVRKSHCGDVVGKGIEPDIEDVLRIVGQGDAPAETGSADAQVPKPPPDEVQDFVVAGGGLDEVGV